MSTATIPDVGYVDGLDAAAYHRHPALSSSGARKLLPPSTPAHFRWWFAHPTEPTEDMQFGTAVHTEILGVGQPWQVAPEKWQSAADKAIVASIRDDGAIPLRPSAVEDLRGMAEAVRTHPDAAMLLRFGVPERALLWQDAATGVYCRALIDWQPSRRALVDLKTTVDASPAALPRHMAKYGYDVQAAHYRDGAIALDLADPDCEFVWIFVEKTPPYLVTVARLAPEDLTYAHERAALARQILRDCNEADYWPGYPTGIQTIALPGWSRRDHELSEEEATW